MASGCWLYPLPCATRPALLGEAAMRRKDQGCRWGEVPKSGAGHPPVLPVDLPPLPTGPDQTHMRELLAILPLIRVAN
jgi:hypothetical protein